MGSSISLYDILKFLCNEFGWAEVEGTLRIVKEHIIKDSQREAK